MVDWEGRLEGKSGMEGWKGRLKGRLEGKVTRKVEGKVGREGSWEGGQGR